MLPGLKSQLLPAPCSGPHWTASLKLLVRISYSEQDSVSQPVPLISLQKPTTAPQAISSYKFPEPEKDASANPYRM